MPRTTTSADLQTIRQSLEANARLTSLSGAALMASGLLAFCAAGTTGMLEAVKPAARRALDTSTLNTLALLWGGTLIVVVAMNLGGMLRRARKDGKPLAARLGRRVLFAMLPALVVGGALTLALTLQQRLDLVFAVWMLCYGAALLSAGAHSVTSIKMLGVWTLVCGVLAVMPFTGDVDFVLFVCTFGAGHFLLGIWVGVRHGW